MAAQDGIDNLRSRSDVIWDEVDGRTVVYNLTTHMLVELNATAAVVWQQLAAGKEFNPVQALSLRYPEVDSSRIAIDVGEVLLNFVRAGLAESVPASLTSGSSE